MVKKTRKKKVVAKKQIEIPKNFSIDLDELCGILNVEIKKDWASLGVDVAQKKTGLCVLRTTGDKLYMDKLAVVNVKETGKGGLHAKLLDYYKQASAFVNEIQTEGLSAGSNKVVVIEDCWMGQSVWTTKVLAKFATMSFVAFLKWTKNIPDPIQPDVARRRVGFIQDRGEFAFQTYSVEGETKRKKVWKRKPLEVKDQVKNFLEDKFDLTIEEDNMADAFILALAGLIDAEIK